MAQASSGPQFIRPDPNLIPPESRTVARIVKSLQGTATFLERIKKRKFDQARAQVADDRAAQLNDLTRQSIALRKIQLDGAAAAQSSQMDRDALYEATAGELNDEQNSFINDPSKKTVQSVQRFISKAQVNLDSGIYGKDAEAKVAWGARQMEVINTNKFISNNDEFNEAQTNNKGFLAEDLEKRGNALKVFKTVQLGVKQDGEKIFGHIETDRFTSQAEDVALGLIMRAKREEAGQIQVVTGPTPTPTPTPTQAPKLDEEGKPVESMLSVDIIPLPTGLTGLAALEQSPHFPVILASDRLTKLYTDAGGDVSGLTEFRFGTQSVFDIKGTQYGFNKGRVLMPIHQIATANRDLTKVQLSPGVTFLAPGLDFEGETSIDIPSGDGGGFTVVKTGALADEVRVIRTFAAPGKGSVARGGTGMTAEEEAEILGPLTGGTAPVTTQPRGVPPVTGNVPSQAGQPLSINVSFSGGELVIEQ